MSNFFNRFNPFKNGVLTVNIFGHLYTFSFAHRDLNAEEREADEIRAAAQRAMLDDEIAQQEREEREAAARAVSTANQNGFENGSMDARARVLKSLTYLGVDVDAALMRGMNKSLAAFLMKTEWETMEDLARLIKEAYASEEQKADAAIRDILG